MSRANTAQIGVRRNCIYSLNFGGCEIYIDNINKLDYVKLKNDIKSNLDIICVGLIEFNLIQREATFTGMKLSENKWIAGISSQLNILKLNSTKEEILYVLSVALHMFGGPDPVTF